MTDSEDRSLTIEEYHDSFTVREAAEELGVSYAVLMRLISNRALGCVRAGSRGKVRIPRRFLEEYLADAVSSSGPSAREQRLERDLRVVVALARLLGARWRDVGDSLGVSRQAAQQRFGTRETR